MYLPINFIHSVFMFSNLMTPLSPLIWWIFEIKIFMLYAFFLLINNAKYKYLIALEASSWIMMACDFFYKIIIFDKNVWPSFSFQGEWVYIKLEMFNSFSYIWSIYLTLFIFTKEFIDCSEIIIYLQAEYKY